MYILGINAYHPDSSACIIRDGRLLAAVEEERFTRIKHWAGLPSECIRYCLQVAEIGLEDIDYIALNRNPTANFYKKALFLVSRRPSATLIKNRLSNILKISALREALIKEFRITRSRLKAKIYHIEHHRAHLASAFFVSPFPEATVVSLDGFGDFTSCMVAAGKGHKLDVLYAVYYPHSLGLFYTAVTQYLGFKKFGDEYKVMGLSAYGEPKYLSQMQDILFLRPQGSFRLNLDYFSFYKTRDCMLWNNTEPVLGDVFSAKFIKKFGPARREEEEITHEHYDIASSLQVIYEKAFFHILNYAYNLTGITNLCLAGGCALNSLANGKIFEQTPFKQLYIQPGASDAGGSLGAAYYLYHQILKNKRKFVMENAYWGPEFSENQIAEAIREHIQELNHRGCSIEREEDSEALCRRTAELIAQGKIVGWFQDRMEWGPRALGNRSILVDPRREEMKDLLNARIKRREGFRPFAPSILQENTSEYFAQNYSDPFMVTVYPIKEEKRKIIPAVTHVDGTGRLQTVSPYQNPMFWKLIKEFQRITSVPVLLNTSFNENEPIVCKPQEALDCFLRTKMDALVIGTYLIEKGAADQEL